MPDDLAEGNLFLELQLAAWPPQVTQTLLRKRDTRHALLVRAKPSGRLRVELHREGYEPLVVRTLHLRLRAPGAHVAPARARIYQRIVAPTPISLRPCSSLPPLMACTLRLHVLPSFCSTAQLASSPERAWTAPTPLLSRTP